MDIDYTVTENVHRNRSGQILQVDYVFEETSIVETPISSSSTIARQGREKRNRTYDASVTRQQYETLARQISNALSFDAFVNVLRPFIMGFYANDELEKAFQTLDRARSGKIHIEELGSFLPILNGTVTGKVLRDYVRKVNEKFDGTMNYDEFRTLVLRGIGRDIICNHL
jgi:Ca2+-binding EF-hand superfamily protein